MTRVASTPDAGDRPWRREPRGPLEPVPPHQPDRHLPGWARDLALLVGGAVLLLAAALSTGLFDSGPSAQELAASYSLGYAKGSAEAQASVAPAREAVPRLAPAVSLPPPVYAYWQSIGEALAPVHPGGLSHWQDGWSAAAVALPPPR